MAGPQIHASSSTLLPGDAPLPTIWRWHWHRHGCRCLGETRLPGAPWVVLGITSPELCPQKPELRWSEYALSFTSNLVTAGPQAAQPRHVSQSEEIASSSSGPNSLPWILDHQAEQDSRGQCMPPSCAHFKLSSVPIQGNIRNSQASPAHPILKFLNLEASHLILQWRGRKLSHLNFPACWRHSISCSTSTRSLPVFPI